MPGGRVALQLKRDPLGGAFSEGLFPVAESDRTPTVIDAHHASTATVTGDDFMQHVAAFEREHGWYAWSPDRSVGFAIQAGRIKVALRLRRTRHDSTQGGASTDLDWRWRATFLSVLWDGVFLGSCLLDTRYESWAERHDSLFIIVMLVSIAVTAYLLRWAANGEMRAAAEAAVRAGYRKRTT